MRTVKEITEELDRDFHKVMFLIDRGKAEEWKESAKKWIHLFEGEYVEALYADHTLSRGSYLEATPRSHLHHTLCRVLLNEVLGPAKMHPGNR